MALLCIVQLVIFYKQGAVATPFLNYGMYSDKIMPVQDAEVFKIYADDRLLCGDDFSIQEWDKIYLPLYMYLKKDSVNREMMEIKGRLLHKLKVLPAEAGRSFFENEAFADSDFMEWYKQYIASIMQQNVDRVKIVKQHYTWAKTDLQPADSVILFQ